MIRRFTFACLLVLLIHNWAFAQHSEKALDTPGTDSVGESRDFLPADPKPSPANRVGPVETPAIEEPIDTGAPGENTKESDGPMAKELDLQESALPRTLESELDIPVPTLPGTPSVAGGPNSPRQHLIDILNGNLPEDWPKDRLTLNTPYWAAGGPRLLRQTVLDPQSKDLSMDDRRHIYLALNLEEIRDDQKQLLKTEDEAERKKILATLKLNYAARFEIDTAYQELKLQEIEQRADKLRAEVNKRAESQDEWVTAMVTLDKMRASGINTMEQPPSSVSPLSPQISDSRTFQGSNFKTRPANTLPELRSTDRFNPPRSPTPPQPAIPPQPLRNTSRSNLFGPALQPAEHANARNAVRGAESLPKRNGNVLVVNGAKGLVELSLGADDGLRNGRHLEVTRRGRYVGKVRVRQTEPNRSVAEILREFSDGTIEEGDRVDTTPGTGNKPSAQVSRQDL